MKKLTLLLAIALIAAFTMPAFASDLKIGGVYHLVGISNDRGYNAPNTDKQQFFGQRFRIVPTWKVNDHVTAGLRLDFNESVWGLTTTDSVWSRPLQANNATMHVDRAFVRLSKDFYVVTVGQQFGGIGNNIIVDHNFHGIDVKFNFAPFSFGVAFGKLSEGGDTRDDLGREDDNFWQATLGYKGEGWNVGFGYAQTNDNDIHADNKLRGYALYGGAKLGPVNLAGEVDWFGGTCSPGLDYDGMNILLDASMAFNPMITGGLSFVYGEGNNSASKLQVTNVHSANAAFSVFDFGGKMKLEGIHGYGYFDRAQNIFAIGGANSGVTGFMARADMTFSKEVQAYLRAGYAKPEETAVTALDSVWALIANIDYNWLPNVWVSFGAARVKPDFDTAGINDDPWTQLVGQLAVSF